MKKHLKNLFLLPSLLVGLGWMLAGRATGQTFTTLYRFTQFPNGTGANADGANPLAGLVLSGNTLYGTAEYGGSSGGGTVFSLSTAGTGFTVLHNFSPPDTFNEDGSMPVAGLTLASNTLYGAALVGGDFNSGAIFRINTDGTSFTNLYSFTADNGDPNADGAVPYAGLVLSGNTLYGTASQGGRGSSNPNGSYDLGTVFAFSTDGTDFTNLHSFDGVTGSTPETAVVLSGNTLFGTTMGGGGYTGTIFRVNTDGTGLTNLYSFNGENGDTGGKPYGGLVLSGNTLYGTTENGGESVNGTIFRINTDGTGFTNIYNFHGGLDGYYPRATLLLSGRALFGTTLAGGNADLGTVFMVNTDGNGFTTLHSFTGSIQEGANPSAGLILSNYVLYGTTGNGGNAVNGGNGTIYSLSFEPQLTIVPSGTNVILTWPTNMADFDYTGFILQSSTNLGSPSWSTVSPSPVIVNGLETVTNAIAGTLMFYRLMQ